MVQWYHRIIILIVLISSNIGPPHLLLLDLVLDIGQLATKIMIKKVHFLGKKEKSKSIIRIEYLGNCE